MAHVPVLLNEIIEILNPQANEFFIDGTIGSAGHSVEILKRILPNGRLLGIDWDKNSLQSAEKNIKEKFGNNDKIIFIQGNYADLPEILEKNNLSKADGLLLDLGFSSIQIEQSGKGFSFLKDEPLIMRYDGDINSLTAAQVINSFNEKELADIFWKYGEERFSRQIAKKIIEERKKEKILTTFALSEVIKKATPRNYERGRINPATRTFQALRIYVNEELENLSKVLKNLDKIVKIKGRIAIISFHSLEDRLVKNCFKQMAKEKMAELLVKKPITASEEEIRANPRSRSAKLRGIKLINNLE